MIADVLAAPLHTLVAALGTGVLPPGGVDAILRSTATALGHTETDSRATAVRSTATWQGAGGDAARTRITDLAAHGDRIAASGAESAAVVERAAGRVHAASVRLHGLADSFTAAATALGPALTTPAGLLALLPIAADHLSRGLAIVGETRDQLAADAAALRRHAPAQLAPLPGDGDGYRDGADLAAHPAPDGRYPVTLPDGKTVYAPNARAATAVRAALSQQGVPYVWGGTTPAGFDCSGFTQWAYRQAGLDLPRLAQDQDTAGFAVSQAELMPGDLAVWSGHVAMYAGDGKFIETGGAPVGLTPVRTTNAGQHFEGFFRPR